MTATELSCILVPLALLLVAGLCLGFALWDRTKQPSQKHRPHSPGPDYDREKLAINKAQGYADGGVN